MNFVTPSFIYIMHVKKCDSQHVVLNKSKEKRSIEDEDIVSYRPDESVL